jgi:hypothetical protein
VAATSPIFTAMKFGRQKLNLWPITSTPAACRSSRLRPTSAARGHDCPLYCRDPDGRLIEISSYK